MKKRLIKRVYPDQDKTIFFLLEERPYRKTQVNFLEMASGTLDNVTHYAKSKGMHLPTQETFIYPDWPNNVHWYYS